ncbi:MAG TPA: hypothetical protein VFX36_04865 [Nitrospira sp.]|nr:hypothetical protein [Nitrospira sp.]
MSSFTVTIVVPTAETESAFLMHAVQAALKAYRNHRNTSAHVNGNGLGNATHVAEKTIRTADLHIL